MAIDGGLRRQLEPGMRLVASYRKAEHMAEVVSGPDGKIRFRLADGREFASPSAAGSAVMGGIACNGWRFWSLAADEDVMAKAAPAKPPAKQATPKAPRASRAKVQPEATAEEPDTAEPFEE